VRLEPDARVGDGVRHRVEGHGQVADFVAADIRDAASVVPRPQAFGGGGQLGDRPGHGPGDPDGHERA
jgi:hypothetical protein